MVIFKCPHCQAKLGIDDEHAGKNIDCPKCQAKSTVPALDQAAAPVEKAGILNAKTQLAPLPQAPPEAVIKTQLAPPAAQPPTIPERLKKTQLAPPPFTAAAPRSQPSRVGPAGVLFFLSICVLAAAVGVVFWGRKEGEPIVKGNTDENAKEVGGKEKQPKAGDIIVNTVGMKLAYIPPGKFLMGSPPGELRRDEEELQHEVTLTNGFHVGAYAVTQEEYQTVMAENPSYFSAQGGAKEKVAGLDTRRFPVERVSWDDATEFCRKLSQKEGKTYRLPTEAEWEYACRAGTMTPFYFGETISTDQANYDGNLVYGNGVKGQYRGRPMPVGSFQPNAWGLYDMHGNVWQWCGDWYDAGYYANSPKINPVNQTKGQDRVLRGGSWLSNPGYCRSARRLGDTRRGSNVGFRVLLSSP